MKTTNEILEILCNGGHLLENRKSRRDGSTEIKMFVVTNKNERFPAGIKSAWDLTRNYNFDSVEEELNESTRQTKRFLVKEQVSV